MTDSHPPELARVLARLDDAVAPIRTRIARIREDLARLPDQRKEPAAPEADDDQDPPVLRQAW